MFNQLAAIGTGSPIGLFTDHIQVYSMKGGDTHNGRFTGLRPGVYPWYGGKQVWAGWNDNYDNQ